jgi:hypothetical protein
VERHHQQAVSSNDDDDRDSTIADTDPVAIDILRSV